MKRVTLLAGHYGSGKTNIAVNMALSEAAANSGKKLAIADLDIVNPYFRTEDSREDLEAAGIRLICSGYANTNVDLPSMPDDLYAITDDKDLQVIIDVGGDDRGALALGRLSGALKEEDDFDMYMVINCYRPLSRDPESTVEIMREIEWAGRMPFTGLINNSNLGRDTSAEDVLSSVPYADKISEMTGLPVVCTSVETVLYDQLKEEIPNLMPLKLQKRPV